MSTAQPTSTSGNTAAPTTCTAFLGMDNVASGDLASVARLVKSSLTERDLFSLLIFDDVTSRIVEIDFRGTTEEVLARLPKPAALQPAKPQASPDEPAPDAREVTLLPRHWEWLGEQRGGASAALRRLVERASRENRAEDERRRAPEVTYRFMSAIGGDLPGFEEASRALFAGEGERFRQSLDGWPEDVRNHTLRLSQAAFIEGDRPDSDGAT